MNLDQTTALCRLLSDSTRLRLLVLLQDQELTVAEMTRITQLAQSRVSTHLAKMREAGLLRDRRSGVSVFYHFRKEHLPEIIQPFWEQLVKQTDDPVLLEDKQRLESLLDDRNTGLTWAESVAGEMRRHYSPGRTWEATSRGVFTLLQLGDVLDLAAGDGGLAEVLAPASRSYTAVDISPKLVTACKQRLQPYKNARAEVGDMHSVDMPDNSFDQVLLLHALTYTNEPLTVAKEAFRLLKPNGNLAVVTLNQHAQHEVTSTYNHLNAGYQPAKLSKIFGNAGFKVNYCNVTSREPQPPHFEVITLAAHKPAATAS